MKSEVDAIFAKFDISDKLCGNINVTSPLTGEKIVSLVAEDADTVDIMLRKSFSAQEKWRWLDIGTRAEFLAFVDGEITANSTDLAKLIHYESGKSVKESIGEVTSTVALIQGTIKAASYETLASGAVRSKVFTPLGIIAIISPFNFAFAIGMWTGIPALLAGNTVINKPSENALLTPVLYEAIFNKAVEKFNSQNGEELIPTSIFQVAAGGPEIGKVLTADHRVTKVVFTGSVAGCEKIKQADTDVRRHSKALTEGGAVNFVVFSDKHQAMTRQVYIRFIVGATMKSFLPYAGQKCINTRQIIAHSNIVDDIVGEFRNQLDAFRTIWHIENAFSEENPFEYAPLVNRLAGDRFQWALQQTSEQGGELFGGERAGVDQYPNAQYFMPALAVFKKYVPLMSEEIFGPFITIVPYSGDIHNALALGQKDSTNLVNAYYGSDEQEAKIFCRKNTAGFALINPPLGTGLLPAYGLGFGGNGLSGQGESLPRDPLLPFVEPNGSIMRSVVFKLPDLTR